MQQPERIYRTYSVKEAEELSSGLRAYYPNFDIKIVPQTTGFYVVATPNDIETTITISF